MLAATLTDFRLPGDEPVFHAINGLASPFLDAVFVAASSRLFGVLALCVLAAWVAVRWRKKALPAVLHLGATVAIVDRLGAMVLKPLAGRMRPSYALPDTLVRVVAPAANVGSMPSLHSANAFAVATVMALLVPRAGWVTYPLAALIAISRVGVGVHWPSDILAGALIGTAIGWAVVRVGRRWLPPAPWAVLPAASPAAVVGASAAAEAPAGGSPPPET